MKYGKEAKKENEERARKLRENPTKEEIELYRILKHVGGELKIQKRWVCGRMIPNFSLPFRNLIIIIEREFPNDNSKLKSDNRIAFLESYGFNVLRLMQSEIYKSKVEILKKVNKFPANVIIRKEFFHRRRRLNRNTYT